MTRLTAPYNFVPLNCVVFTPDWADKISMDLPLTGAISGHFDLVLIAVSPLMIGAGQSKPEGEDKATLKSGFRLDCRPAIPGTSLKGMVRNVLEIASFGKIAPRIDDRRYGLRDMYNHRDYLSRMTEMFRPLSRAGWLSVDPATGDWRLTPCWYAFVRQTELEILHAQRGQVGLGTRQSAKLKYEAWKLPLEIAFDPGPETADGLWAKGRVISRASNVGGGNRRGVLVFTGQPQDRSKRDAKQTEFIFHAEAGEARPVSASVRDAFEFVHRDPNTRSPNEEWAYWRPRLFRKGGTNPGVLAGRQGGRNPRHRLGDDVPFGLRLLDPRFRRPRPPLPCRCSSRSGRDAVRLRSRGEGRGTRPGAQGAGALSPALLETEGRPMPEASAVQLAPKPNFYAAYVGQRDVDAGGSVPPGEAHLLRRRRQVARDRGLYHLPGPGRDFARLEALPVSRTRWQEALSAAAKPPSLGREGRPDKENQKVRMRFTPLGPGSRFRASVHVHNVKPEELGALVWSLTFGGQDASCHSLGMGRPLGLGAVSAAIDFAAADFDDVDGREWLGEAARPFLADAVTRFTAMMDRDLRRQGVNVAWEKTPQIQHLLAMADPIWRQHGGQRRSRHPADPRRISRRQAGRLGSAAHCPINPWPPQAPIAPSPNRASASPVSRSRLAVAAQPAHGTVDGEAVEILGQDEDHVRVRFVASGDIDYVSPDEVQV